MTTRRATAPERSRGPSGQSVSLWMATERIARRPPLAGDARADVCVIGAGIAGLTAAYLAAVEGRSVIVLDDGPVGGGMTGRSSAHLSHAMDVNYQTIGKLHGQAGARLAAESHTAAIDRIEAIARLERIRCEFDRVDGFLFVPHGQSTDVIDRELTAAHDAGLAAVERLDRPPLPGAEFGPCLRFPDQAQFHPLKYLAGLARAIERHGGRICNGSRAEAVEGEATAQVRTTAGHAVTAGAVVVATNTPIVNLASIHAKQAAYLTYVIGARVPEGSIPRGLFWDTEDPYHYVRLHRVRARGKRPVEVLLVGGEDHKTGQADDADRRYAALEAWARERFSTIEGIDFRWSGQVMNSLDGLAFIGPNPGGSPNVYVATGDTGMGLTHGTIAGMLITDLIAGRGNPWGPLYDPSRVILRAAPELVKQNLGVAAQYADWLTPGEVPSVDKVARGTGAIIRRGLAKIAVYRDERGRLHERSAVCPHLGCIVAWNSSERTWDCPCHGSRFDALGRLMSGPSNTDLSPPK